MAKFRHIQTNFTGGELAPRLYGRVGLNKYKNSVKTLNNMIVTPHGGARKRPGTEFIAEVKDSSEDTFLIPFQFNNTDTYMIEAGDFYFRFYRNGISVPTENFRSTWNGKELEYGSTGLIPNFNDTQLMTHENVFTDDAAGDFTDNSTGTGTASTSETYTHSHSITLTSDAGANKGSAIIKYTPGSNCDNIAFLLDSTIDLDDGIDLTYYDYAVGTTSGGSELGSGSHQPYAQSNTEIEVNTANTTSPIYLTLTNQGEGTNIFHNIRAMFKGSDSSTATTGSMLETVESGADISLVSNGGKLWVQLTGTSGGNKAAIRPNIPVSALPSQDYTISQTIEVAGGTVKYKVTDGADFGDTTITSGSLTEGYNSVEYTHPSDENYYIHYYEDTGNEVLVRRISMSYGVIYSINTPWTNSEIPNVRWTQSHDSMFFVHSDHEPKSLSRAGHSDWTLSNFDTLDGPYLKKRQVEPNATPLAEGSTANRMTVSTVTGSVDVTCTAGIFTPEDNGRYIRWRQDSTKPWGYLVIAGINSSTSVIGLWVLDPSGSSATTSYEWHMSAWSERSTAKFPSQVAFFEQRLVFSSSKGQPLTIWGSRSGSYDDFSPDNDTNLDEVDDDTSVSFTLSSNEGGAIEWMSPQKSLFLGTTVSIHNMKASSSAEAITPNNINITKETSVSVKDIQQVDTDNSVLFVNRYERNLHELAYSFEADSFQAPALDILSEHLTYPGIKKIVRQEYPDNVIWILTDDGKLRSMTFLREQEVIGWARHEISGTDVVIKDIQTVPGDNEAELWMIVQRTVDGNTVQYIEKLTEKFDQDDIEDAFFVDSGLTYTGASTTTITGLDHLEGETVVALNNGTIETGLTVSSGSVTLATATTKATIGLAFDAELETNPFEPASSSGTIQGKMARPISATIRVLETIGGKIGVSSLDTLDDMVYNEEDAPLDANGVRTGDAKTYVPHGYKRGATLYLKFSDPTPATVSAIITDLDIGNS